MSAIQIENVVQRYGETPVLQDVSLCCESGQFTSLLGPSGSGKTTLLRVIAGFVAPDRGRVHIGGVDVTHEPVWKRRIGMVFQSYALFPHMSVAQNIAFGLNRRGVYGQDAIREVAQALALVRLEGMQDRMPKQLSGGQQQRVALARAIVTKPTVLLLDEPFSALDRRLRHEMQGELRRIQRESGLTTVFVTHDQEEALTLSSRIAILDRGRIVQVGEPCALYDRPRSRFAAAFLGDANFLSGVATEDGIDIGGPLLRSADPLPPPGSRVTLMVRPEKIALVDPSAPDCGKNRLAATVRESIFGGAAFTYRVDCLAAGCIGGTLRIFTQNQHSVLYPSGAPVLLEFDARHAVLLTD